MKKSGDLVARLEQMAQREKKATLATLDHQKRQPGKKLSSFRSGRMLRVVCQTVFCEQLSLKIRETER